VQFTETLSINHNRCVVVAPSHLHAVVHLHVVVVGNVGDGALGVVVVVIRAETVF